MLHEHLTKLHLVLGIVKKQSEKYLLISSSVYIDVTDLNLWIPQKHQKQKNLNILRTKQYFLFK